MKRTTTEAELRAWNDSELTSKEIAEILGCHVSQVNATYFLLGISSPRRKNYLKNLERAVLAISNGVSLSAYCKQHGLGVSNLHQALRRAGHPTTATEYLRRQADGLLVDIKKALV